MYSTPPNPNPSPYDPYQPPRHDPYGQYGGGQGGGPVVHYQPLGWKTTAAAIGIVVNVVLGLILGILPMTISGPPEKSLGLVAIIGLFGLLSGAIGIGTIIVFLLWMHQAAKNVRAFGQQMLEFTPGWAVGWWFVPVASWWLPYKALREIWKASDPESVGASSNGGTSWSAAAVPALFPVWWATYMLNSFAGMIIGFRQVLYSLENPGKPNFGGGPVALGTHVFLIIAAVAIVSIMKQLDRRQETAFHKLRG